jgi:circadian clock protein KaiB
LFAKEFAMSGEQQGPGGRWVLRLFVSNRTPKSVAAFKNLKRMCEEHLAGNYRIEVIDLIEQPLLAREEQIVAIPTVVRRRPLPMRRVVGDLSNTERTLRGLQLGRHFAAAVG